MHILIQIRVVSVCSQLSSYINIVAAKNKRYIHVGPIYNTQTLHTCRAYIQYSNDILYEQKYKILDELRHMCNELGDSGVGWSPTRPTTAS